MLRDPAVAFEDFKAAFTQALRPVLERLIATFRQFLHSVKPILNSPAFRRLLAIQRAADGRRAIRQLQLALPARARRNRRSHRHD